MESKTSSPCDITATDRDSGGCAPVSLLGCSRRYSVVCVSKDHKERIVATGLSWNEAREMSDRLDAEYRAAIERAGRRYSTWTADLHEARLESPKQPNVPAEPSGNHDSKQSGA